MIADRFLPARKADPRADGTDDTGPETFVLGYVKKCFEGIALERERPQDRQDRGGLPQGD